MIDLDAVRKQKQRSWTDPLGYMTGRLPLTASGLLITQNGIGRFQLESAEISGITIPKSLLQELLSFYSKSRGKTFRHQHGRPLRAARKHQGNPRGQGGSDGGAIDTLQSSLQYLKGVGPRRAADLERVGLHTVEDLLYRFPIRYEDRGTFQTIAQLRPGVTASVLGEVVGSGIRPTRRPRFKIFELVRARQDRRAARHLVQSAISQRRIPAAPARHPLRQAGADVAWPADAESAVRGSAAGRRRRRRRH